MDARSILVRAPNWAGDIVMSTPGFRALREGFPRARIAVHVRAGLEPLVTGTPWFDDVIPLDVARGGVSGIFRAGRAIRARQGRFDLGVCIPDSFSAALIMRAAGVRHVVGYRRGGRGLLLHRSLPVPQEWGRRRIVARERFVLGIVEALGCESCGTELELFTTQEEEERADSLLGDAGNAGLLVAIAPGASFGSSKLWPAESFARVADGLVQDGARVVLLGAPDEIDLAARVAAAMRSPVTNLVGSLDLGSLKAVIRRASLLVCNDAGARHVAVAFGVPCVVFFGPTSVEKTNLNLERVSVLETDVECRPCYRRECPIDHRCMTRIESQTALDSARAILSREPV